MIELHDAILAINPKAEVSIKNNDIKNINWVSGTTPISEADIKAKMTSMEYIPKRQAEYPSMADQLDDIYNNGVDAWKATIKTVKDKYPKG